MGELSPPGRYRITLALVRPLGHVPHLIRAILRSFLIYYFSTDLFDIFCSHAEGTMNEVVDPLHGIPVYYCLSYGPLIIFSKVSSASLISQSDSFTLPAVMGCTGIALLSQSTQTHRLQWILCFRARGWRNLLQGNPTSYWIKYKLKMDVLFNNIYV